MKWRMSFWCLRERDSAQVVGILIFWTERWSDGPFFAGVHDGNELDQMVCEFHRLSCVSKLIPLRVVKLCSF